MGDTTTLRCISRGGNPLAQLVWYRNQEERIVDSSYTTSGRESINTLTFVANSSDNNAVYRCVATNVVSPEPVTAAVRLTVQCEYTTTLVCCFFKCRRSVGSKRHHCPY